MTTKEEAATAIQLRTPWKVEGGEVPGSEARALDCTGIEVLRGRSEAVRAAVALANKTLDLDEKAARLFWKGRAESMEKQANAAEDRATKAEKALKEARAQLLALGTKRDDEAKPIAVVRNDEAVAALAAGKPATLPAAEAEIVEAARATAAAAAAAAPPAGVSPAAALEARRKVNEKAEHHPLALSTATEVPEPDKS